MTGLRAATRNTLTAHGPAMLAHPQRFVAVVTDFIDVESPEALVLYESCDEQFFAEFANALEDASSSTALSFAVVRAAQYLNQAHGEQLPLARRVALLVGAGVADYVGQSLNPRLF